MVGADRSTNATMTKIAPAEFAVILDALFGVGGEAGIRLLFQAADIDGDGFLSLKDIKANIDALVSAALDWLWWIAWAAFFKNSLWRAAECMGRRRAADDRSTRPLIRPNPTPTPTHPHHRSPGHRPGA